MSFVFSPHPGLLPWGEGINSYYLYTDADFGEFGRCDGVLRPVSRMIPAMKAGAERRWC